MAFTLADALALTQKTFKQFDLKRLSEADAYKGVLYRESGCLAFDWGTANHNVKGGLPRGKVIELSGLEGSGKTTLACIMAATVQRYPKRNVAVFLDYEHKLDMNYAVSLGLQKDKTLYSMPSGVDAGPAGLTFVKNGARADDCGIIVIDSVPAVISRSILEGDIGDANIGANARMWTTALAQIVNELHPTSATIVLINQMRDNVGAMFGPKEKTAGAKIIRYTAPLRVYIKAGEKQEDEDTGVKEGMRVTMRWVKNQCGEPFQEETITMMFGQGYENEAWLVDKAIECGVITSAKKKDSFNFGLLVGMKKSQLTDILKDDPALTKKLYELCVATKIKSEEVTPSSEPNSKEEPPSLEIEGVF